MGWIAAGVAVAALVALGVVIRLFVLILTELRLERVDTEDDPIDWEGESTDEARTRRIAPRVRRAV